MKLSELETLISPSLLRKKLLNLPKGYYFSEQETVEFLSRRRWPESNRRIDRTTFWRWRNDTGIQHQRLFSRLDILKLCQICDHYRIDGTRIEYLNLQRNSFVAKTSERLGKSSADSTFRSDSITS